MRGPAGNGAELHLHIPAENGFWRLSRCRSLLLKKAQVGFFKTVTWADRVGEVPEEWADRKNER